MAIQEPPAPPVNLIGLNKNDYLWKTLPSYGVTGFPETYVLNREGRVVQAFVGAINSDEDHAQLQSAVARALSS